MRNLVSDKNEILQGHFGRGHVRQNRAKIAKLRKKQGSIRTTLRSARKRFFEKSSRESSFAERFVFCKHRPNSVAAYTIVQKERWT